MLTQEMKDWFGNGEYDIDAMLKFGVLTEDGLLLILNNLIDSPWYGKLNASVPAPASTR